MRLNTVALTLSSLVLASVAAVVSKAQIEVAPEPLESRMQQAYVVCACVVVASDSQMNPQATPHGKQIYVAHVLKLYRGPVNGSQLTIVSQFPGIFLPTNTRYLLLLSQQANDHALLILSLLSLFDDFPPSTPGVTLSFEDDLDAALQPGTKNLGEMLRLLDQFHSLSAASQNHLRELVKTAQPTPALLSASMLLTRQLSESQLFSTFLVKLRSTPESEWPQMSDLANAFLSLASVADEQNLEALAGSNRVDVSLVSVMALRKIADPTTTGFFIRELASSNTDIQYLAVISLAEIQHKYGEFAPGMGRFELDRERYLRLWRDWYNASQH